jgi:hypothetical protein
MNDLPGPNWYPSEGFPWIFKGKGIGLINLGLRRSTTLACPSLITLKKKTNRNSFFETMPN